MITLIFTFQYGYIQINQAKLFGMDPGSFTFQYGYIQIFISLNHQIHITALYIPIWLYSNNANKGLMHIFVFFTFQPGYIQMINVSVCRSWICTLYIPTWLYSNRNAVGWVQGAFSLYIPTWLYSNLFFCPCISCQHPLHSNLVIFKCMSLRL